MERRDSREPFLQDYSTEEDWLEYQSWIDGELRLERANSLLHQLADETQGKENA